MALPGLASLLIRSLCCLLLVPAAAAAQLAPSLSITSEVRNRGLSLNGGRPALTASLAYDHPSGVYAGASVTGGDTRRFGPQFLGHSEYIGYAARLDSGLAWDVGLSNTQVDSNVFRRFSGHYTELYAGLSSDEISVRVYFSPDYLVPNLSTLYLDLNGAFRPARRVRVFGHGGLLMKVGGQADGILPRSRYDLRIGVAGDFKRGEVQLAWVRSGAGRAYLAPRRQSADALVLGATWFF